MRNDQHKKPEDGGIQWKHERNFVLGQLEEHANKHDKLRDEVIKNRIDIAVIWTKVALIAIGVSAIGGIIGSLIIGVLKIMPAIIKALQNTPPK